MIKKYTKLNILVIFYNLYSKNTTLKFIDKNVSICTLYNKYAYNFLKNGLNYYDFNFYNNFFKKKLFSLNNKDLNLKKNLIFFVIKKNYFVKNKLIFKSLMKNIKIIFYHQNCSNSKDSKAVKYFSKVNGFFKLSSFYLNTHYSSKKYNYVKDITNFISYFAYININDIVTIGSISNNRITLNKHLFVYSHQLSKYLNILNLNVKYIFYPKLNFIFFFNKKNGIDFNSNSHKKSFTNVRYLIKYLTLVNDFFLNTNPYIFYSNKYLINYFNIFELKRSQLIIGNNNFENNLIVFNNYYPVQFLTKKSYSYFSSNLKFNYNLNYLNLTNKIIVSFLEMLLKKSIFIKIVSNRFNKLDNFYLNSLLLEYKNFQPQYFKNFLFHDFLNILWYSFMLKDLKLLSQWVSKFMETLNFKNHKKFVNFFQNFITKYSSLFIDILKIKGFFFDIRGKVGVTGSSKKRHLSFKFGSINRSSKNLKMNFNQNLVRTYSGVLGLTYIICF